MSRGICGRLCTVVKRLRFLCFASLLAIILTCAFSQVGGQGGVGADIEAAKPPTPGDQAGNETPESRHSSGTITITMTGMVGDPGDIGG